MDTNENSQSVNSLSSHSNNTDATGSQKKLLPCPKTGRKGDPRMHRAVAARLSNPTLSLFEALKIGGFEYSNDDDTNLLDKENVTLGQRKNQLSRRVRLARQHQDLSRSDPCTMKQPEDVNDAKVKSELKSPESRVSDRGLCTQRNESQDYLSDEVDFCAEEDKTSEESPSAQKSLLAKYHPEYQPILVLPCHKNSGNQVGSIIARGLNNGNCYTSSPVKVKSLHDFQFHGRGKKFIRRPQIMENFDANITEIDSNFSSTLKRTFSGKIARIAANTDLSVYSDSERCTSPIEDDCDSYHNNGSKTFSDNPDSFGFESKEGCLSVKRTFSGKIARLAAADPGVSSDIECGNSPIEAPSNQSENDTLGSTVPLETQPALSAAEESTNKEFGNQFQSNAVTAATSLLSIPQMLPIPTYQGTTKMNVSQAASELNTPQKSATGLTMTSLTQTAATVGLTLEQLALALENCSNLKQVLLSNGEVGFKHERLDLAVALYQAESISLYQRAMLLSSYVPDGGLADEKSAEYLQFVVTCWQAEGKRIQKLVTQLDQNQLQPQQE